MIEITTNKFKDVDIPKLAKFMFESLKGTVFHDDSRTIESTEQSLQEMVNDENEIVIIASKGDEIVGALRIYVGFPEMAFTARWHPIIIQGNSREQIAVELIHFCKDYVKGKGFSRLEFLLSPLGEKYSEVHDEYKSWYEEAGFYKATEEVFMQVDLSQLDLSSPQPELPEGLRFEKIENVSNDEIKDAHFKSFTDRGDRLFLDMTLAQQTVSFNYWLRRSQPFHRSSILVMKDDDVIGFNVVRQDDDKAEIGPVAIIPEYKRKGIMTTALYESLKRMQEDGLKFGQLEADALNTPAIKLYTKYGFQTLHSQEYYAWRVE